MTSVFPLRERYGDVDVRQANALVADIIGGRGKKYLDEGPIRDPRFAQLVSRYGPKALVRLVNFAYKWKYEDWHAMRANKGASIPDMQLCQEAFAECPLVGLFRGVTVKRGTKVLDHEVNTPFELKLGRRSISSWTEDWHIARNFSHEENRDRTHFESLVLELRSEGDVVILASPANSSETPGWYRTLYFALTTTYGYGDDDGGGDNEGEGEYILSMSHASVRIIERGDDVMRDPRAGGDRWRSKDMYAKVHGSRGQNPDQYGTQVRAIRDKDAQLRAAAKGKVV